ncbi:hypothetical protein MN032_00615 [Agromyces atrinae]|uniref:hypothetical protein n=1 Tax=Agromyces atrinae TaxID=592376 RepID=UPI001F583303|nr:hypothetical protein [Agromyces atrinae]MCI2956175.1 hypothetical protein [Agromyces atrinae]
MDEQTPAPATPASRRTTLLWVIGGVAVILVGALVWFLVASNGGAAKPGAEAGETTTVSDAPTPIPATATPTAVPPMETPSVDEFGRATAVPVPFEEPVPIENGITIAVTGLESVEGEAQIPGEVSGPAIRVTVDLRNDSAETISLRQTIVNLYYGDSLTAGNPILQPGGAPLPEEVAAGASATGVYVFSVPADDRERVRVEIDVDIDQTIVLFEGPVVG